LAPPNLGAVITSADIDKKGTGSYAADYVNWCRTAQLLREHAPGWQFHLRPTANGQHVWSAPNGTGYVVGYFQGPGGDCTPDFPQAVMDNRNVAVALENVDARDLTDTHRRCLCTAAAAQFGLAWQLWAKEPVENPHRQTESASDGKAADRSAPANQSPARRTSTRQAAPTSQAPSARPQQAQQPSAVPGQVTLAAVTKRCLDAGMTPDGMRAMAYELSKGKTAEIGGLNEAVKGKILNLGVSAAWVAKWNAAGASSSIAESGDDDPPLAWGLAPITAAA